MQADFLLYGSYGFVGAELARLAVGQGLRPLLAGRDAVRLAAQAEELELDYRAFRLTDTAALDAALAEVPVAVHYAGPFVFTFQPMIEACLRTGTHYLDITGELEVYEQLAALDQAARDAGIMILPGAGFDVVPTDCLAVHLQRRLPSATQLTLAFSSRGPAGLPPGTAMTILTAMARGKAAVLRRTDSILAPVPDPLATREVDFGWGPTNVWPFTWGDVFTAHFSTGIPNIGNYLPLPPMMVRLRRGSPLIGRMFCVLMRSKLLRKVAHRALKPGSTAQQRAKTRTHVWGEVTDQAGGRAVSLLQGPEAGVDWTTRATLLCLQQMLSGAAPPGFQTPAKAFGPELVMDCEGVSRQDLD